VSGPTPALTPARREELLRTIEEWAHNFPDGSQRPITREELHAALLAHREVGRVAPERGTREGIRAERRALDHSPTDYGDQRAFYAECPACHRTVALGYPHPRKDGRGLCPAGEKEIGP